MAQPIQLDGGSTLKGHLHFVAEFIPTLALKHVGFDAGENEIQKAAKTMNGVAGGDVAARTSSPSLILTKTATVDSSITEQDTDAAKPLHDTNIAGASQTELKSPSGEEDLEKEEASGLELDKEELLTHRTSLIFMAFQGLLLI